MLVIEKKEINNWLKGFSKKYSIINTENSVLSFKEYFFPPIEETFVFNKKLETADKKIKEFILFGLSKNDLEALIQLDEIMKSPKPDYYYLKRREKSIVVGLCNHSVDHFVGGDLVFEKINSKQYKVLPLTGKGDQLIKSPLIKDIWPKVIKYAKEVSELRKMLVDPEILAEAVKWSKDHRIWDELGKKCLGCGNCTYVCPICHCFSTIDSVSISNKECKRCRYWDACTLPEFSEVAGGHNFKKTIKERYYNWFYHKFVRAYHEYGKSQCVGCKRCALNCPAGIDIEEVLSLILKDFLKKR